MRRHLAALIVALPFCALAHADTLNQIQTVTLPGAAGQSIPTDLHGVSFSGVIHQFQGGPVPGTTATLTLTDVILTATLSISTQGSFTNQASQAQNLQFDQTVSSYLGTTGSGATAAQQLVQQTFGQGTNGAAALQSDQGTVAYNGVGTGATVYYPNPESSAAQTQIATSTLTLTDAASLAAFSGSDDFGITLTALANDSYFGSGGNFLALLHTAVSGTFTVQYDMTLTQTPTATPEPSALVLVGTGLVGMAGVLRRRFRR